MKLNLARNSRSQKFALPDPQCGFKYRGSASCNADPRCHWISGTKKSPHCAALAGQKMHTQSWKQALDTYEKMLRENDQKGQEPREQLLRRIAAGEFSTRSQDLGETYKTGGKKFVKERRVSGRSIDELRRRLAATTAVSPPSLLVEYKGPSSEPFRSPGYDHWDHEEGEDEDEEDENENDYGDVGGNYEHRTGGGRVIVDDDDDDDVPYGFKKKFRYGHLWRELHESP